MGKVIHWELCKKLKFHHTNKWYIYNPESFLENGTLKVLWDFEIQTDHLISARRPNLMIVNNKKKKKEKEKTYRKDDFVVPTDHRVKSRSSEKGDKYLDFARELKKKKWKLKVSVIPIVIGALGTILPKLIKGLGDLETRGQVETIQTTAFLRSAWILRRVLETWGDLLSLRLQWKTIS